MSIAKKQKTLSKLTVEELITRNQITAKRVLMRVDFNVPFTKATTEIANPQRVEANLVSDRGHKAAQLRGQQILWSKTP